MKVKKEEDNNARSLKSRNRANKADTCSSQQKKDKRRLPPVKIEISVIGKGGTRRRKRNTQ